MDLAALTSDTYNRAADKMGEAQPGDPLAKVGISVSDGMTGFNVEAPAKLLVSFLATFRQTISRKIVPGGSTNWKRILTVTAPSIFTAEGVAGGQYSFTKDVPAVTYKTLSLGGKVTWEANVIGRNYEDARNRSETMTLLRFLLDEEKAILGGNITALGTPAAPTATKSATGGSIPTGASGYAVRIAALTAEGMSQVSATKRTAGGTNYDVDCTTPPAFANAGANGIPTIGCTLASTAGTTAATTGTTGSILVTWTAIAGAFGYAIYCDDGAAGTSRLQCVVAHQTKVNLTALNTTGGVVPTGDTSANANAFDGIVAQLHAAGSGAYSKNINATLSAASGNQIPEIAAMIFDIYDRTKGVEPDRLLCGYPEAYAIDKALQSVTNDRISVVYQPGVEGPQFQKAKYYPSPISGKQIPIDILPTLPGGRIIAFIDNVPLPSSEIPAAWQMHMGEELMRIDYPMTKAGGPNYEHEVREMGALAGYATLLQGSLYNIHPSS